MAFKIAADFLAPSQKKINPDARSGTTTITSAASTANTSVTTHLNRLPKIVRQDKSTASGSQASFSTTTHRSTTAATRSELLEGMFRPPGYQPSTNERSSILSVATSETRNSAALHSRDRLLEKIRPAKQSVSAVEKSDVSSQRQSGSGYSRRILKSGGRDDLLESMTPTRRKNLAMYDPHKSDAVSVEPKTLGWVEFYYPKTPSLNYVPQYQEESASCVPPAAAPSASGRVSTPSKKSSSLTPGDAPDEKLRNLWTQFSYDEHGVLIPQKNDWDLLESPSFSPAATVTEQSNRLKRQHSRGTDAEVKRMGSANQDSTLFSQIKNLSLADPAREIIIRRLRTEQQQEAQRFLRPEPAPSVIRQKLEKYAVTANTLLSRDPDTAGYHLKVEGNVPLYLSLHSSNQSGDFLRPFRHGEKLKERVAQDYWFIALKKVINAEHDSYRGTAFQEGQGTFGERDGGLHMVISSNTAKSNLLILETMGIDHAEARGVFEEKTFSVEKFDMYSFVHQKLIPDARKAIVPTDESSLRRMKKLEALHDSFVPRQISVHVLVDPHGHAEVGVHATAVKLGLKNIWAPRGTKTNCLSCATLLTEMGVTDIDAGTRRMYFSNLVEPQKLQNFLKQNPHIPLSNQVLDPKTNKVTALLRRRISVSPSPPR